MEKLTKEQLEKEMRELREKMQLDFILDLKERVENYAEKTNKKSYIPSERERIEFNEIRKIIEWISNYL